MSKVCHGFTKLTSRCCQVCIPFWRLQGVNLSKPETDISLSDHNQEHLSILIRLDPF